MSFEMEKRDAARLLAALEDGEPPLEHVRVAFQEADPALVYLIFAWLRAQYHSGHPASDGVLGRIVELCSMSSAVARQAKKGESDAIVTWFEETYNYRDLDRDDFIAEIVEKLEG